MGNAKEQNRIYGRLAKQHLPRVLNELLDLHKEGHGLPAIKQAVVICESEVHHLNQC